MLSSGSFNVRRKKENLSEEKTKSEKKKDSVQEQSSPKRKRRKIFSRRNGLITLGLVAVLFVFLVLLTSAIYRFGYIDEYIKEQFVVAFDEMNVSFDADKFHVSVNPLQMTLENATFNNKKTGEKIARIGNAKFNMTVLDLYALSTIRNVNIDYTDINDLEVWIDFQENGKSNFDGIEILPPKNAVRFQYASAELAIKDSVIHFGDKTRKINGNAKNIKFFLEPVDKDVPDDEKRYKFDFTSSQSDFVYDESKVEPVDIQANGTLDQKGAEIAELKLTTPLGNSVLNGTVKNWESPEYDIKNKIYG